MAAPDGSLTSRRISPVRGCACRMTAAMKKNPVPHECIPIAIVFRAGLLSRDTDNGMLPRQITHQNVFRVLIAGFSLVILLLMAAAVVGGRHISGVGRAAGGG